MNPEYVEKVGRAFLAQTGRGLLLSPRDHTIVEQWSRAGIPADIVIEGIESAFATPPARRVNSIAFASHAVDRAAQAWRSRKTGKQFEQIDHSGEWETKVTR